MNSAMMLPAAAGTCPLCAVVHDPAQPHNFQSLFYRMTFHQLKGRGPTVHDALRHCTEDVKAHWLKSLAEMGHPVPADEFPDEEPLAVPEAGKPGSRFRCLPWSPR